MSDENVHVSTRSHLAEVVDSLKGFWQWWLEELAGVMPQALRSQFRVSSKAVLIEVDGGVCRLQSRTTKGTEFLTEFRLDEDPDLNEVEQRKMLISMTEQIVLLLPDHYVLSKIISLPQATSSRLENVLQFEMDRNTPFKAEDVYFNYQILNHDTAQQTIQVKLEIVTRTVLDELISQLVSQGITPSSVVPQSLSLSEIDNPAMSLLPRQNGTDKRRQAQRKRQQKVWIALVLIALVALWGLYQRYQRVEVLTQQIEEPRALAQQAKKLRSTLEQLQESQQFLFARKTTSPSVLILLRELTSIIPDNTWLTRLVIKDGEAALQGESANASALIGLIEETDQFQNVRFSSPVTINSRTEKERFSISAQLTQLQQGGAE